MSKFGLIALVGISIGFFLYVFIGTHCDEIADVEYSERYVELLEKGSLTKEDIDYMDAEMKRVQQESLTKLERARNEKFSFVGMFSDCDD